MPLVSVVMPVYNAEKFLAEAIESILAQTFSDFELIIVDDGSTDGSAGIIQAYAEHDSRIRAVQLDMNEGVASARNRGTAETSGKYIAGMDSDDISLPERLQQQVEFLESHPAIGAVGVGTRMVHEDLTPRLMYRLSEGHALIVFEMLVGGPALVRGSLMVRGEILLTSRGYDPEIKAVDDFELFLRLVWEKAIRYANVLTVLYIYRRHESSVSHGEKTWPPPAETQARRRALELLWGEAPEGTLERFMDVHFGVKLSWRERRLARRDFERLIVSLIEADWIEQVDRSLLLADMHRRLEKTTPRLWQKFLHWWRYRIGPFLK